MQYAYKPEELERLKKTEMEVLAAFIEICEKHDLPYFLNGGTAIGAVRHQGFIPWDDDMDVGMLRDDYGACPPAAAAYSRHIAWPNSSQRRPESASSAH